MPIIGKPRLTDNLILMDAPGQVQPLPPLPINEDGDAFLAAFDAFAQAVRRARGTTAQQSGDNGTLTLSRLTDEYCEGVSPGAQQLLEPGATATFTCYDAPGLSELIEGHFWINEATITATDEAGESETKTSNRVTEDP